MMKQVTILISLVVLSFLSACCGGVPCKTCDTYTDAQKLKVERGVRTN